MQFSMRNWGVTTLAVFLGLGCSSSPTGVPVEGAGGGGATAYAVASSTAIEQALTQADAYYITQYHHAVYNPNQRHAGNANCGPTSLAMALRAFGKEPAGLESRAKANELVLAVRKAMTGTTNENTWTYPVQVRDGARRFGLKGEVVFTLPAIQAAMAVPGRLMVVNVNPTPAYVDQLADRYDGGHFALVTAIKGNQVYLSDPLASGPIVISLKQLETALTTPLGTDPNGRWVPPFDGGVALWSPN
ncbi:MAG: hypothetical protein JWM80_4030 [Cyanobacteria bacterium RYN_339]|nr:hypothetical protein [Cyanobacteria bacterium RYN_339]